MTMPTGKKIEKWEKEFEEKFFISDFNSEDCYKEIKKYIKKALSSQLKEVLGVIESNAEKKATERLIKRGKDAFKDKCKCVPNGLCSRCADMMFGANSYGKLKAYDDIKAELSQLAEGEK